MLLCETEPIGLRVNSPNPSDRVVSDSFTVGCRILSILCSFEENASNVFENLQGLKNIVQGILIKKTDFPDHSILKKIFHNSDIDISLYLIKIIRFIVKRKENKKILLVKVPDTVRTIC